MILIIKNYLIRTNPYKHTREVGLELYRAWACMVDENKKLYATV